MMLRRIGPASKFAIATALITAAAWLETYLVRWPCCSRLEHRMFERLFSFYDNWGAACALVIVLLVWLIPWLRSAGERLADVLGRYPWHAALLTFVVLALGSRFAYEAYPLAMDESVPLAQAYAFAQGKLSWVVPLELMDRMIPTGFRGFFVSVDPHTGAVASLYWPGFALLLTPFAWAGAPWLLNPAIAASSVLLIHAFALRVIGSPRAAGWAILFALGSPAFVLDGISFYSMSAHLAANLLFALLLLEARPALAFLAGLVGGYALVLHNPIPHVLFAIPWGCWLLANRSRWPAAAALVVGYLPFGVGLGATWPTFVAHLAPQATSASPASLWELAIAKFGQVFRWPGYETVVTRLTCTWKLWIWDAPGLLILSMAGLRWARRPLALLAASFLLTYAGYWFVPFDQGHGWGYRYVHSAWAALPLLAATMIAAQDPATAEGRAWRRWAGGLALGSLVLATSLRLWQAHAIIAEQRDQVIPPPPTGRWVVFVTGRAGLYTWDLLQNFPGKDRVLLMMSFSRDADAELMRTHFPGAILATQDDRGSLWNLP